MLKTTKVGTACKRHAQRPLARCGHEGGGNAAAQPLQGSRTGVHHGPVGAGEGDVEVGAPVSHVLRPVVDAVAVGSPAHAQAWL
jgi:hypothetical protein